MKNNKRTKALKHTPGPWEAVRYKEDPSDCDYIIEETNQRGIVADIPHCCTNEWTKANALLIAKSPEMINIIDDLIHYIVKNKKIMNCFFEIQPGPKLLIRAKAVSLDAKGQKIKKKGGKK